jgi:GTPase
LIVEVGEQIALHTHDRSGGLVSETSILARMVLPNDIVGEDPLDEIRGLAETAGTNAVAGLIQRREHPEPASFLGKGKVEELKELVELHDADVVLFDNDLSPAQTRNLETAIGCKVLDRSELILDIFASHARTFESRLAVELAQLEYSLPRLKRMWTHLSRQTMGVGMRGPGEKQLEVDRRLAEKRIHELKLELEKIERRKAREVSAREGTPTVSLVGYTNAGKSTLMNALTNADVEAVDKLFATLDTRTRRWQLPEWGPILLSDTVGFIRDLPHRLIASFRATLEEARQADLLLHVADASNPAVLDQISAVYKVLKEIEIDEKDTVLLLNKIDRPGAAERLVQIQSRYPNAIPVSAKTKEGFSALSLAVSDALSREFVELEVRLDPADGKTSAWITKAGEVLSKQYEADHVHIHARMAARYAGKLAAMGLDLRVLSGKLPVRQLPASLPPAATFKQAEDIGSSDQTSAGPGTSIEEVA